MGSWNSGTFISPLNRSLHKFEANFIASCVAHVASRGLYWRDLYFDSFDLAGGRDFQRKLEFSVSDSFLSTRARSWTVFTKSWRGRSSLVGLNTSTCSVEVISRISCLLWKTGGHWCCADTIYLSFLGLDCAGRFTDFVVSLVSRSRCIITSTLFSRALFSDISKLIGVLT